mmetsp:Transcript_7725/g.19066  ORF Transcript_7725/g.19066 Transcript_7725/m.19066 type:complete len:375 (+) Transcript_7725:43-1167(+)
MRDTNEPVRAPGRLLFVRLKQRSPGFFLTKREEGAGAAALPVMDIDENENEKEPLPLTVSLSLYPRTCFCTAFDASTRERPLSLSLQDANGHREEEQDGGDDQRRERWRERTAAADDVLAAAADDVLFDLDRGGGRFVVDRLPLRDDLDVGAGRPDLGGLLVVPSPLQDVRSRFGRGVNPIGDVPLPVPAIAAGRGGVVLVLLVAAAAVFLVGLADALGVVAHRLRRAVVPGASIAVLRSREARRLVGAVRAHASVSAVDLSGLVAHHLLRVPPAAVRGVGRAGVRVRVDRARGLGVSGEPAAGLAVVVTAFAGQERRHVVPVPLRPGTVGDVRGNELQPGGAAPVGAATAPAPARGILVVGSLEVPVRRGRGR